MEDDKICITCGRSFSWRKKWKNSWEEVQYCSKNCSKNKGKSHPYKDLIMDLLKKKGTNQSISPSDVMPPDNKENKEILESIRMAARLLAHQGLVEITQKGQVVSGDDFKGPIQIRLKKL